MQAFFTSFEYSLNTLKYCSHIVLQMGFQCSPCWGGLIKHTDKLFNPYLNI